MTRKPTFEERTRRITIAVPRTLHQSVTKKLPYSNYGSISDLVRSLLRKWTEEEVIEVKPIG